MKLSDFPDDILRQVFMFLEFKELRAFGPLCATIKMLGIRFEEARWALLHHEYVPFEFESSRFNSIDSLSISGRMYSPSYREWINCRRICYSPWEYTTTFRNDATPDVAPRVIPCNLDVEITYRGRRRSPRRLAFRQGREVDVMDPHGVWWKGSMVACRENLIQYHFHGWESRWDHWYPNDSLHVAPLYSITKDWLAALQIGDSVDVKKDRYWFSGVLCEFMESSVIVNVNYELVTIELSSERLMFHGAHTYNITSFLVKNPVWRDKEGVDVYQYRMRNTLFLADHVLSDAEIKHRLEN